MEDSATEHNRVAIFLTSKGRSVPHSHVDADMDLKAVDIADLRAKVAADFPNVTEVGAPTLRFNCHGFAYADAHGWFESPTLFIRDDFSSIPFNEVQVGDVVIYKKTRRGRILHSAIVEEVAAGEIQICRSKWGDAATLQHGLREVPKKHYGRPRRLLRRRSE